MALVISVSELVNALDKPVASASSRKLWGSCGSGVMGGLMCPASRSPTATANAPMHVIASRQTGIPPLRVGFRSALVANSTVFGSHGVIGLPMCLAISPTARKAQARSLMPLGMIMATGVANSGYCYGYGVLGARSSLVSAMFWISIDLSKLSIVGSKHPLRKLLGLRAASLGMS